MQSTIHPEDIERLDTLASELEGAADELIWATDALTAAHRRVETAQKNFNAKDKEYRILKAAIERMNGGAL